VWCAVDAGAPGRSASSAGEALVKAPRILYTAPRRLRTEYRIGLSAWTDRSMLEEGEFYPRKTMTAEERLWWYSRYFDVVEVNSSFYAIPSAETAAGWVERTPPGFLFNVKALGLLTGHHVDAARLPDALKRMVPVGRLAKGGRIPSAEFDPAARAWALRELRTVLRPLQRAGKLGYVLFQLAPWVKYADEALDELRGVRRALPEADVAVEFRNRSWFGARTDETLAFLRDHRLTYVSIDGPRSRMVVPSLPALTTATAVFRLHGRNFAGFLKQVQGRAPTVAEKYDYLYSPRELEEIAGAAGSLNGRAARVHIAMNNNRRDYPVTNGMALKEMLLEDWHPPDRDRLVQELDERRARTPARSHPRRATGARQSR
jgi:uncharacterized protein YecE (DUF72 family)